MRAEEEKVLTMCMAGGRRIWSLRIYADLCAVSQCGLIDLTLVWLEKGCFQG